MTRRVLALGFTFILGAIVGHVAIPSFGVEPAEYGVVMAQSNKPLTMTRLFTGPDNQTHAEEIDVKFGVGGPANVFKMLPVTGAELHRSRPGSVADWHVGPRRQYVITLSGRGEIEVAGGQKFPVGPGQIDLIEDTTGKGHITRETGTEERITLWLPLVDQSTR